jgi:hypothetical protein
MEQFFGEIGKQMRGYEEFEKEGWSFKVSLYVSSSSLANIMIRNSMIV